MTYKKIQVQNSTEISQQIADSLTKMEISVQDTNQNYNAVARYTEDDFFKLVYAVDYQQRIVEINMQPSSALIIGAIVELGEDQTLTVGKSTYCLCNDSLKEGALIQVDDRMKHYAMPQKDDIYRAITIGKVLQLHDKFLYFDPEGNKKTPGEYEISIAKELRFNQNGPTVARRPSIASVRSNTSTISQRVTRPTSRLSTGRAPLSSASSQTPRKVINKYQLVSFI